MTLEEIRAKWPKLRNAPHGYYDIKNAKQTSAFPPGRSSAFYQPFIDYFTERAQTADAQRRLYLRKRNLSGAQDFESIRRNWEAARVCCVRRQTEAFLREQLEGQRCG